MTPQDFDYLRQLLRQRSGLVLSAEKQYLAESRLLPVARRHSLTTLAELVGKLKIQPNGPLSVEIVQAMTTNETSSLGPLASMTPELSAASTIPPSKSVPVTSQPASPSASATDEPIRPRPITWA